MSLRFPHPLVLLTGCIALAAAASWVLPAGEYERRDDPAAGRRVVVAGTPDELKGELRGDAVQVELPADADPARVRQVLAALPAVRDVVIAGRDVSARSDGGAAAVPVVLAELQRAGVNASSVAVARPSLDDVYLRHTGRRYSESETSDHDGHENELETAGVSK